MTRAPWLEGGWTGVTGVRAWMGPGGMRGTGRGLAGGGPHDSEVGVRCMLFGSNSGKEEDVNDTSSMAKGGSMGLTGWGWGWEGGEGTEHGLAGQRGWPGLRVEGWDLETFRGLDVPESFRSGSNPFNPV